MITASNSGIRSCERGLLLRLLLRRQLARVAALGLLAATPRSRNVAPSDSTCSRTAGRTSKPNDRAEPARGRDRLQPGDAGAEDEHLRRRDRAGRGRQHRQEPRQAVGGDQRRLVAGDGRLRRERVHRLRARDARDRLQREREHARAPRAARRRRASVSGCRNADQHLAVAQPCRPRRRSASRPWRRRRASHGVADRRAGLAVRVVRETGRLARAGLDDDLDARRASRPTVSGTSATRRSPAAVSFGTPRRIGARRYRDRRACTVGLARDAPDLARLRARPALRARRGRVGGRAAPGETALIAAAFLARTSHYSIVLR